MSSIDSDRNFLIRRFSSSNARNRPAFVQPLNNDTPKFKVRTLGSSAPRAIALLHRGELTGQRDLAGFQVVTVRPVMALTTPCRVAA